jgi:hypothetical protein
MKRKNRMSLRESKSYVFANYISAGTVVRMENIGRTMEGQ